ncbi:hypothetical protein [Rhodococcus sp. IEGM 1379]|uniref:hypothetical protein n=1 Tax=Rhodococcus sp. IEGM 1379 TaxID=3047086 RepID=UPI0024B756DD|nr:hypothetical protein [Rhodococcus sp. IEGM 1379]MDI9917195.1 hypothetical protein [Rhodococcus sp. IEGM 1379]
MGTFTADVEELVMLGGVLHGLADEAGLLRVGPSAGPYMSGAGGVLQSLLEAASISSDLVEGALVPALKERLGETGDIMVNVAEKFRSRDEQAATDLATTYTNATGTWNAQDPTA